MKTLIINSEGYGVLTTDDGITTVSQFKMDERVKKKCRTEGAGQWHGIVVGMYISGETIGYAVRSEREINSVQIYPEHMMEKNDDE